MSTALTTIGFPVVGHVTPGSFVRVFGDALSGVVDYATQISENVPVWSLQQTAWTWGSVPWGQGPWGGVIGSQGWGAGVWGKHLWGGYQDVVWVTVEAPVGDNIFGAKFYTPASVLIATAVEIGPVTVA